MLIEIRKLGDAIGLNINNLEKERCVSCDEPFTDKNVHTPAGWRETKISGMCEVCFDKLFTEDE